MQGWGKGERKKMNEEGTRREIKVASTAIRKRTKRMRRRNEGGVRRSDEVSDKNRWILSLGDKGYES